MRFRQGLGRASLLRRFRLLDWLAAGGMIFALAMMAREADKRFGWSTPAELAGFAEAIDGDSLKLLGWEIRLKGIDAPELTQYCQNRVGRDYACGVEAKRWLRTRLGRGAVVCRIEGRDRYGRLLGFCQQGREVLNAAMVRDGIAIGFGAYEREQEAARAAGLGLWAGAFVTPSEWRAQHPRS